MAAEPSLWYVSTPGATELPPLAAAAAAVAVSAAAAAVAAAAVAGKVAAACAAVSGLGWGEAAGAVQAAVPEPPKAPEHAARISAASTDCVLRRGGGAALRGRLCVCVWWGGH